MGHPRGGVYRCLDYAADILEEICIKEEVSKDRVVLHSDNASPMKDATMLATLQRLGVIPSFSRPGFSNDNPFSESLFRTLKYHPTYPFKPFSSLAEAREWVYHFVRWYNTEHLHSGIKFVTPDQRHSGKDVKILKNRSEVYALAKTKKTNRWSRGIRDCKKDYQVLLNPERSKSCNLEFQAVI